MHVIVIGAGVIGSSVAAHLAEAGATVTVLERQYPGAGTTSTSYAWVNSNGKEPEPYFHLNAAGVRAHHQLAEAGAPWLVRGGHLEIATDDAHARHLHDRVSRMRERDYPVEEVTLARARELAPDVEVPDGALAAVHFPVEAHAYPLVYTAEMLHRARAAGARILTRSEVVGFEQRSGGALVRTASGEEYAADVVVSATGRWTAELAGLAGVQVPMATFQEPGDVTVGYLATTDPLPVRLDRLVTTSWLNLRPECGGRLMVQALDLDVTADPGDVPSVESDLAQEYLRRLRAVVPAAADAGVERLVVGQRAMPADGLTVVGHTSEHSWLYVIATHSGVTLAPVLGPGVAKEVLGGHEPLFDGFRPSRFAHGVPASPPRGPRKPGEQ